MNCGVMASAAVAPMSLVQSRLAQTHSLLGDFWALPVSICWPGLWMWSFPINQTQQLPTGAKTATKRFVDCVVTVICSPSMLSDPSPTQKSRSYNGSNFSESCFCRWRLFLFISADCRLWGSLPFFLIFCFSTAPSLISTKTWYWAGAAFCAFAVWS